MVLRPNPAKSRRAAEAGDRADGLDRGRAEVRRDAGRLGRAPTTSPSHATAGPGADLVLVMIRRNRSRVSAGVSAAMLGQTSVVVQVEVEACTQDAGKPAQRTHARCRREVGDDVLDRPPSAQRSLRPLRLAKAGEIVDNTWRARRGQPTTEPHETGHRTHSSRLVGSTS